MYIYIYTYCNYVHLTIDIIKYAYTLYIYSQNVGSLHGTSRDCFQDLETTIRKIRSQCSAPVTMPSWTSQWMPASADLTHIMYDH